MHRTRKRRNTRRSSPYARVIAKLNRRGRSGRKSARRRNPIQLLNRRRRNGLAVNRRRPSRRRNSVALQNRRRGRKSNRRRYARRNSVALQNRRRRTHRRRYARRNPVQLLNRGRRRSNRRHGRRNPIQLLNRRHGRRRNGLAVNRRRRNRGAFGGGISLSGMIFKPIAGIVAKIPVIGKPIAPYIAPVAFGALGLYGVHYALKFGSRWIPAQVKGYVAPFGYTLGGALLGIVVNLLPLASGDKKTLTAAMVVGGAGVDAFRYMTGSSQSLGEGGLWQVAGPAMGAVALSGPPDMDAQSMQAMYADALPADAQWAGNDFDDAEGQALLAGPRAWRSRFPYTHRASRVVGACSRWAGQHGHRWGWLCRLVGPQHMQAIAAMPDEQRVAYIQQLRSHAIASIPAQLAAQQAEQATSGLGALLYAGG